jgi:hypothetical protein
VSDTPEKAYAWAGEHFCSADTRHLYDTEPERIHNPDIGFPVELDSNPEPPTFCSRCLLWFDDPQHTTGSDHRPPEKGTTNGSTS